MLITISIPDDSYAQAIEAYAKKFNYQAKIMDDKGVLKNNPMSKDTFFKKSISDPILQIIGEYLLANKMVTEKAKIDLAMKNVEIGVDATPE